MSCTRTRGTECRMHACRRPRRRLKSVTLELIFAAPPGPEAAMADVAKALALRLASPVFAACGRKEHEHVSYPYTHRFLDCDRNSNLNVSAGYCSKPNQSRHPLIRRVMSSYAYPRIFLISPHSFPSVQDLPGAEFLGDALV